MYQGVALIKLVWVKSVVYFLGCDWCGEAVLPWKDYIRNLAENGPGSKPVSSSPPQLLPLLLPASLL